jgi:thymidylate synthase (FAD)
MKIIKPSIQLEDTVDIPELLKKIQRAGQTCYKSDKISNAEEFFRKLIKNGHESVIEHVSLTFRIICDRGVSHELVRHRIASYSQESTRYCNYSQDRFGNELTFIEPFFWAEDRLNYYLELAIWRNTMKFLEKKYLELIEMGSGAQEARSILPNSLKTEVVMTANLREWRHFLKLRTAKDAHPQMREVALMILKWFRENMLVVVEDIKEV